MKKVVFIVAIVVLNAIGNSAFAETPDSKCLTINEQKKLGSILFEYHKAFVENPECMRMWWGYDSCLSNEKQDVRHTLENKLMSCAGAE